MNVKINVYVHDKTYYEQNREPFVDKYPWVMNLYQEKNCQSTITVYYRKV